MRKASLFLIILCLVKLCACKSSLHPEKDTAAFTNPVKSRSHEESLQTALALADSGYFDRSNTYLSEAAEQFFKLHNWTEYCTCLNQIAANCLQTQDFEAASRYIKKSLDTGIHYTGNKSIPVAQAYTCLGELYIAREKFGMADTLLRRAMALKLGFFSADHPAIFECKYNLGRIRLAENEYTEALAIEKEVLDLQYKALGKDHKDVALTHNVLGLIYYYSDEYERSLDHYRQAEQITRKVLGKNHPQLGKIYNSLGIYYWNKNDLEQAKFYFEKAMHIFSKVVGRESLAVANTLGNLGMVCYNAEDYEGAISYYNSSLEVHVKQLGKRSVTLAKIISNRGLAYLQLGNLDKALKDNIESLEIRKSNSADLSSRLMVPVYSNLLLIYGSRGHNGKAVAFFEKAHGIYNNPSEAADMYNDFNNIAQLYLHQQKYDKALFFMRKTQAYTLQKFGRLSENAARESKQIGDIWLKTGNPDSALLQYQQSIGSMLRNYNVREMYNVPKFSKTAETPFLIGLIAAKANALKQLYDVKFNTKYLKAAYAHYVVIIPAYDELRNNYKGEEAKYFLNAGGHPVFQQALDCAYKLYRLTHDERYIDQAFLFSEKSKAAVLLNALKDVTAHYSAGLPDSLLAREVQLKTDMAFYKNLIYQSSMQEEEKAGTKIYEWQSKLGTLQLAYDAFVKELERDYPSYYQLKYQPASNSVASIKQSLSQNRALVSYTLTDSLLYIFTIRPNAHTLICLHPSRPLAMIIREFQEALMVGDYPAYTTHAYLLYQYLIAPVQQHLVSVRQLTIIPDGQLGYIPFDILLTGPVLPDKKNYKVLPYLLGSYQCSYYHSAALWMEALKMQKPQANKEMLAVAPGFTGLPVDNAAAPDANKTKVPGRLLPLKWAQEEVKALSSQVRGMFLSGASATEKKFKQEAGKYGVLHVATHAIVEEEQSAYSKLVFSEDTASGEDGYLHTYELYNMKLHASLVALSACNTGNGQLLQGEGVISLARGFIYAGCPNVLMSLWSVNDRSTSVIMKYFYEGLLNGLPKDEALHQAKTRFIAQAGPLNANPYFWGGFVLVGDSAPVQLAGKTNYILIFVLVTGFLLGVTFLWRWYVSTKQPKR